MLVKSKYLFTKKDVWVLCTVVYIEGAIEMGGGAAASPHLYRSVGNTVHNTHTSLFVNKYLLFTNIEFSKTSSR